MVDGHFILGGDYHLGDLLWITPVLKQYRETRNSSSLTVWLPDRPINRILEHNPLVDRLMYGGGKGPVSTLGIDVRDLRQWSIAREMIIQWRRYLPWLYYRDLWLKPRGQWLATYLELGELKYHRPVLHLLDEDREAARQLPNPYIVLAPAIGSYSVPMMDKFWRNIKGWDEQNWVQLASHIRSRGMEPVTLGAADQEPIPGTRPLLGLPIRQAAGIIEGAEALVSVESGLWFIAAALAIPFIIVPWWLSRWADWPASMGVPYRLVDRSDAHVPYVLSCLEEILSSE